jgi:hypothetical protein
MTDLWTKCATTGCARGASPYRAPAGVRDGLCYICSFQARPTAYLIEKEAEMLARAHEQMTRDYSDIKEEWMIELFRTGDKRVARSLLQSAQICTDALALRGVRTGRVIDLWRWHFDRQTATSGAGAGQA